MNPHGQSKPGTPFTKGGNPKSAGSRGSDPLAGQSGRFSTGTKHTAGRANNDSGGKMVEGQKLRGYVLNEAGRDIGSVKDGTVAADGTRRVRKL